MKPPSLPAALLVGLMSVPFGAQAAIVSFTASDPVGDHLSGTIDVTGLRMTIDNQTGGYQATLFADPANPFVGYFNVETALGSVGSAVFTFDLAAATTNLTVGVAVDVGLGEVSPGEEVFVFGDPFDAPPFTFDGRTTDGQLLARVRVTEGGPPAPAFPGPGEFVAIYDEFEPQISVVSAVPLPAGGGLFLSALGVLGLGWRQRCKSTG